MLNIHAFDRSDFNWILTAKIIGHKMDLFSFGTDRIIYVAVAFMTVTKLYKKKRKEKWRRFFHSHNNLFPVILFSDALHKYINLHCVSSNVRVLLYPSFRYEGSLSHGISSKCQKRKHGKPHIFELRQWWSVNHLVSVRVHLYDVVPDFFLWSTALIRLLFIYTFTDFPGITLGFVWMKFIFLQRVFLLSRTMYSSYCILKQQFIGNSWKWCSVMITTINNKK